MKKIRQPELLLNKFVAQNSPVTQYQAGNALPLALLPREGPVALTIADARKDSPHFLYFSVILYQFKVHGRCI